MKNKYIIIIQVLFLIINSKVAIQAQQCFDFYVQTPNLTNVKACERGGYSSFQVQQADAQSRTYAIEVLEGGTDSYNCHAYAWHVSEGGNKVWINNMYNEAHNVDNYWLDNSYYQVPFLSGVANLKVFYGSTYLRNDHSAVTTTDPNVFISKMGCGALVKHYKNNSPYDHSNLKYYKRTPLTISGPTTVCNQATYTVENLPQGATVHWSVSNPNIATINSSSGVLTCRGSGICEVQASVNNSSATLTPLKIYLGAPASQDITLTVESLNSNGALCTDNPNAIMADHPGGNRSGYIREYEWRISSGWQITDHPGNNGLHANNFIVTVIPLNPSPGYSTVSVRARSECGWGAWKEVQIPTVSCNRTSRFSLFPNPATDAVTLQLNETDKIGEKSTLSTSQSLYEIQLWSGMTMLKSYKTKEPTFQINIAGLPAGIYFVRVIKDGQSYTEKLIKK